MFQMRHSLSLLGLFLSGVVSASESRLVDMLYCRVTSALQTLDIEAEVSSANHLKNLKVWNYGHGSASLIEQLDDVVGVEVADVLSVFKSYRSGDGYGVSGALMKGPAIVFKLDQNGDGQLILSPAYTNGSNSEARLITAGRDSPVQFHSFQCRVSPSYTR